MELLILTEEKCNELLEKAIRNKHKHMELNIKIECNINNPKVAEEAIKALSETLKDDLEAGVHSKSFKKRIDVEVSRNDFVDVNISISWSAPDYIR